MCSCKTPLHPPAVCSRVTPRPSCSLTHGSLIHHRALSSLRGKFPIYAASLVPWCVNIYSPSSARSRPQCSWLTCDPSHPGYVSSPVSLASVRHFLMLLYVSHRSVFRYDPVSHSYYPVSTPLHVRSHVILSSLFCLYVHGLQSFILPLCPVHVIPCHHGPCSHDPMSSQP